jgi:hypothetical protein
VNAYASLRCSKFFTNAPVSFQKTIAEKMIANERTIRDGAFAEAIPQTALASQYPRLAERLLVDYAVAELPRVAESPYETDDQQRAYRAENLVRSKPFYSEAAIDALVVALTSAIEHYPSLHELKYLSRYVYCDLVAKASPSLLSRYRKSLREGFHARAGDNFKQSSNYERAQAEYFEANEELFFELTIDEHRSEQGLTVVDSEVITRLGSLASACLAEPIPCAYEDHFKYITGFSFVDWFTSERARGVLLRAAIKNPKILAMVVQIAGYRKETLQDFNSEALRSGVEADFLKALQVAVAMVPAAQNGSDYVGYLVSRFVYDQRATKEVGGLYQTIQTDRHSPTSERIRAHLVELEASERRLRGEDLAFLRKNPSILDATQLAAKPEALRALADMLKETSALVAVTDFDLFPDATNAPANFSIAKRMLSELGEVARPHVLLARASVDQKHAYQEIEKLYRPYWNSLLRHQTQFGQTAVSLAPFAVELFPQEGFEPFFEGVIRALLIEPSQVRVAPGSEAGSDRVIYELGRTWMTQAFFTLENSEHGQAYLLGHPKLRDAVANQILAGNLDIKLQTWVQPAADGSVTSFLSDAMFEALKVRLPSDKSAYLNSLHFESRLGWYSEDLGEPLTGQWVLAMLNDKRFEDMNLTLEFVAEFNRLAPGKLIQLTQAPVGEKAIWYGNGLLARAFQSSLARMIATATRQKNSAKLKMYRTLLKQHELELRLQNYVNACDEALRAIARSR